MCINDLRNCTISTSDRRYDYLDGGGWNTVLTCLSSFDVDSVQFVCVNSPMVTTSLYIESDEASSTGTKLL